MNRLEVSRAAGSVFKAALDDTDNPSGGGIQNRRAGTSRHKRGIDLNYEIGFASLHAIGIGCSRRITYESVVQDSTLMHHEFILELSEPVDLAITGQFRHGVN